MAAIGNSPTQQAFTPAIDYFSGNGSTTAFTLSRPVASVAQVQVTIDNVAQNPSSAFTVSANTITFTSAPLSGTNNIYVYYTSPITQVIAPSQGTVQTAQLGNITNIASGNSSLTLQTGSSNTTAVTVDTSQNVGIGTTSPAYKLDVQGGTTRIYNATFPSLRIQNSATGTGSSDGLLVEMSGSDALFVNYESANMAFSTANTERMRITAQGNVGINCTPVNFSQTSGGLQVANTAIVQCVVNNQALFSNNAYYGGGSGWKAVATQTGYQALRFSAVTAGTITFHTTNASYSAEAALPNMDGSDLKMTITAAGNIGAPSGTNIYNASDARLKKNIQPLTKGLDAVNALKPVSFNWITDFCEEENDKTLYGFVAQDTKEVDEHLVESFSRGGSIVVGDLTVDNPMRVNEKFIIPMLTKAIQELKAINDAQAATINALTARIEALERK